jgi:hypothetical protein
MMLAVPLADLWADPRVGLMEHLKEFARAFPWAAQMVGVTVAL